jgi:superfamily II DNA/RNA helicase
MADMGFLPDVKRILDKTPENRQTLLFSATLDGDIDVLVKRYQHDPARHELEVDEDDASAAVHLFWKAASGDRVQITADIATAAGPTIVFSRTKHGTDRIARQLEQRGIRAAAIHGDRSQKQREKALDLFVRGAVDALVATDVAARGIHVDGVNAVVHFDPPADSKDYVHRSGRTARAGATGVVVSLVTPDKAAAVKRLQRDLGVPIGTHAPDMSAVTAVIGEPPARRPSEHRGPQGPSDHGARRDRPSRPGPSGKPWNSRSSGSRNGSRNGASTNGSSANGSGGGDRPQGAGPGSHKKKVKVNGTWVKRSKPTAGGQPSRPGKPRKPAASGGGGRNGSGGQGGGSHDQRRGGPPGGRKKPAGSGGSRRAG